MSLGKIIDVTNLASLVKKGIINRDGVRVLQHTYVNTDKPDWRTFEKEKYAKFEQLMKEPSPSLNDYKAGHIPGSIHVDVNVAMYPAQYERYGYYPPHIFEQYVQLLGINKDEHLIFCGRDRLSGMLGVSKLAWLFKSYGHEKVSLLDGGLDRWQAEGQPLETGIFEIGKHGNWTAKNCIEKYNIRFEELYKVDENNKKMIDQPDKVNFLDCRVRDMFHNVDGKELEFFIKAGINLPGHIEGHKNAPIPEVFAKDGKLKTKSDLKDWLISCGYKPESPTVTVCIMGIQAALLAYVMDDALPNSNPRLDRSEKSKHVILNELCEE
ncbi:hypothetical protein WR25_13639 [Diploscapter pachys]|uniref:Rhodanese domain-containing protein n=1 Tax=Diploscapter pachys TaxID=2018661 RepID=A0A2A2KPT2_9BILA|nr:hypothetical protein WR25_13639 [Diploscapter pachys]